MIAKKLLVLAVVAGVLLVHLNPALARHSTGSTTKSGTTKSGATESVATKPEFDLVCFVNFVVQASFDLVAQTLGGAGSCLPCDEGAGPCVSCLSANVPIAPIIPDCTLA